MPSTRPPFLRHTLVALAAASALTSGAVQASPDALASAEINRLLDNIGNSNCTFIRSGAEYTSAQARQHLQHKLNYAISRLDSTEQFIDKVASGSSTTGESYQIRCGKTQTPTRTWLDAELKRLRSQR